MDVVDFDAWREQRSIFVDAEIEHARKTARNLIAAHGEGWAGWIAGLGAWHSVADETEAAS